MCVAARYLDSVYVGKLEGEDSFTLIKYMEKKGPNENVLGKLDPLL